MGFIYRGLVLEALSLIGLGAAFYIWMGNTAGDPALQNVLLIFIMAVLAINALAAFTSFLGGMRQMTHTGN
jgi:hypothetical protein